MQSYDNFIDTLAFLPTKDVLNMISTCKDYHDYRAQIIKHVFFRKYPELSQDECTSIGLEPTEFNLVYIERMWGVLSDSLTPLLEDLSLLGLDDRLDDGDYDKCRKEISQFSLLVSRIQSTYDKLFELLMNHLLEHYEYEIPGLTSEPDFEDEDVDDKMEDYEHFEDSDDFELFIHALMRKGQSFYSKLLQSDDPFSLLTDMMEERGEEFCIEGMQFPGECGYRIDCVDDGLLIDTMYEDDDYQEKAAELIEYLEDEGDEEATIMYELEMNNFSTHQYEDMHDDLMGNIEDRLDDCDPLRLMSKICESNLPDDVKDEIYAEFHSAVTEILATKNNRILKSFLDGLR